MKLLRKASRKRPHYVGIWVIDGKIIRNSSIMMMMMINVISFSRTNNHYITRLLNPCFPLTNMMLLFSDINLYCLFFILGDRLQVLPSSNTIKNAPTKARKCIKMHQIARVKVTYQNNSNNNIKIIDKLVITQNCKSWAL